MPTIIFPVPPIATSALTFAYRADVPVRYACPILSGGFLINETDGWNCNLCGSATEFNQPYVKGDIIPFQTRFADNYNIPNSVLTAGIKSLLSGSNFYLKIELLDGNGILVSDFANDFCSDYWVGYSEKVGSVQTWFVNTGLLPDDLKCWKLKLTYYRYNTDTMMAEEERVIYTEPFQEVHECDVTVKIESVYSNTDCNNNYYRTLDNYLGTSNLAYYNSIRIFGEVDDNGDTSEIDTNDRSVTTSQTVTYNFIVISSMVPPYFYRRVSQAVRGRTVTIDGIEYIKFELSEKPNDLKMFPLDVVFKQECIIDEQQCNF